MGDYRTDEEFENGGEKADGSVVKKNGEAKEGGRSSLSVDHKSDMMMTSWRRCCFTSMMPFALYYGVVNSVTSALGVYLTSQVTTLEKQFGLSSSESGLLMSMNDAGFLVTVVFVAYFGRNSHIPRILAACCFLYGVSALICIIPCLFTENTLDRPSNANSSSNYSTAEREERMCSATNNSLQAEECTVSERNFYSAVKSVAMALISTGMFLQGVSKAPRIPLLQTYVDDNVTKTMSGFYIGIIMALSVFGPALSFAIGGVISRIYVTLEETNITPRDPRWVGAWWLGFLIFGVLAIILSFPVCLFPKRLRRAVEGDHSQTPANQEAVKPKAATAVQRITVALKGFLPALWRLATSPVYVCFVVGAAIKTFSLAGIMAFTPKYMQTHYQLTVFKSNLIVGFLAVGSACTGIFLGGVITRKFRFELKGMLRFIIITQALSSVIFLLGVFLACPQPEIQGFELSSQSATTTPSAADNQSSCSAGCNCGGAKFFPVCGSNNINYYSPCHAGCAMKTDRGYYDCLCISNQTLGVPTVPPASADATPGMCEAECSLFTYFAITQFMASFVGLLGATSTALIVLRMVDTRDKSLAVGINSFIGSILGWFLGPLVMGSVVDSTCRLWSTSCAREGSCDVYDIRDMRLKVHGVDFLLSVVYVSLYILSYVFLVRVGKRKSYALNSGRNENVKESGGNTTPV